MNKQSKGFTIIELIVVIAIIAVLAGIVLVNVAQYSTKSKLSAIKADLSQVSILAAKYFEANGNYSDFCNSSEITSMDHTISSMYGESVEFRCHDKSYPGCVDGQWSLYVAYGQDEFCTDYKGYIGSSGIDACSCNVN